MLDAGIWTWIARSKKTFWLGATEDRYAEKWHDEDEAVDAGMEN